MQKIGLFRGLKFLSAGILSCVHMVCVSGQDSISSYVLEGVVLRSERAAFFAEDRKIVRLDSMTLKYSGGSDVGEVIAGSLPLFVNQYGSSGSISNVSIRGTQSNHTLVSWNGIPINSGTLGSTDLSMIPCGFSDEILINYGASGTLFGSGTFGGAIDLNNKFISGETKSGKLFYEKSSFGSNKLLANMKLAGDRIQYSLTALHHKAINDFKFVDEYAFGSPEIRLKNNELINTGIFQQVNVRISANQYLKTGIWYQNKYKEIPPTMGSSSSTAFQKDSTLKSYFVYSLNTRRTAFIIKSGLAFDNEHYQNDSLISLFHIRNNYNELNLKYRIGNGFTSYTSVIGQFVKADVSNYRGIKKEVKLAAVGGMKYETEKTIVNVQTRIEKTDDRKPYILYSLGSKYQINSLFSVQGNFSTKYRTPTFNERYWEPGGNPDLDPEKGWTGEASVNYCREGTNIQGTFYYTRIQNLIQWVVSPVLQPVPEKEVSIYGFETDMTKTFKTGLHNLFVIRTGYAYTKSKILDVYSGGKNKLGKELIYVPNHIFTVNTQYHRKSFFTGMSFKYTGKRYTDEDNNDYFLLSGFPMMDIAAGYSYGKHLIRPEIVFKINNLLDTSYQVHRSYPMPGRYYALSVILHIN